jgi:uncharacterized protein
MRRWLLLLILLLAPFGARAEVAVPPLTSHVTDLTQTLTAEQRADLDARLAAFEAQKGSQIAVLLVPTTQPEDIAQYSIRVVDVWKLGRKKVDDGVLLLVARNDHKMRIEVGYGLEGALPDVIAKRIVADDIAPHFRQGDYYGGINAGVERIMAVIQGEPLPAPQQSPRETRNSNASVVESYLPILIFVALVAGFVLRNVLGTFIGALVNGGLIGGAVLLLGGGIVFAAVLGVMAFAFALAGVGFWGGGFGGYGGGYGGGLGGGGGFSGGGGGFGGGGASGDW